MLWAIASIFLSRFSSTPLIFILNEVLAYIGEELNALSEKRKNWSEARLHKVIDGIVGSWKDFVHTRVKRKGTGSRIEFKFRKHPIALSERLHGKYMLFSSDESLPSAQVVKAYFEKDFVEKVFRTLKTTEEIEPVRHRLEQRVKVYIFVCVLAYRLLSYLERVERVKIKLGIR